MEFLTSDHGIAKEVREKLVFKIVPMMNPDGVLLGNTRSTLMGADLNRSWHDISEHKHPVLHAVNDLIMRSSEVLTQAFFRPRQKNSRKKLKTQRKNSTPKQKSQGFGKFLSNLLLKSMEMRK